jgi:hypothetical protein
VTRATDYLTRYQESRRQPLQLVALFLIVVAGLLLAHDWFFAACWIF